jgi:hypothetical protein
MILKELQTELQDIFNAETSMQTNPTLIPVKLHCCAAIPGATFVAIHNLGPGAFVLVQN